MSSFRKEVQNALNQFRVRYWKRQKFLLRPMSIGGRVEIPAVTSSEIEKLAKLEGGNQILAEKLVKEYFDLVDKVIEGYFEGLSGKSMPEIIDYAEMRGYTVIFQKGDITINHHYDPVAGQYSA